MKIIKGILKTIICGVGLIFIYNLITECVQAFNKKRYIESKKRER